MSRAEIEASNEELAPYVATLADTFIQRRDLYARQLSNGQYIAVYEPLSEGLLYAHLRGSETLGAYVLDHNSQGRYMVLDADVEPDRRRLVALAQTLNGLGCPSYLEASRRGGHLWFFLDKPRPGKQIRRFGKGLMAYFNLADIELFPKQSTLRTGPGSLVRLPFGIHRKSGRRYGFFAADRQRLAPTMREQIMALQARQTVPERLFDHYSSYASAPPPKPVLEAVEAEGETVSDRIKAAANCHEFISQYVVLDARGRGLCPFHDDNLVSFSVNRKENYWHCFAGCGAGSIIDFYMIYRQRVEGQPCDFKTAVTDLARLLLVS
jgi:hypothetical protein